MWWGTHVGGFRDRLRESGSALADVFRNPALRRLQLAFIGSIVGDRAFTVAVAVYAYAQGGPTAVGVVAVVRYLSMAVVVPARLDARRPALAKARDAPVRPRLRDASRWPERR